MNKNLISKVFVLCGAATLVSSLIIEKDNFLHAEKQETMTYTADAATDSETMINNEDHQENDNTMPLDMNCITLTINEAQNHLISDLTVKINGIEYPYASSDYIDNVLSLNIDDDVTQMIELQSQQYYFEPSFIIIDPADFQDHYSFQAFAGSPSDAMEGAVVFNADGMQKDQYDNDETVTVSIATKNPLHRIFYQIENEEWKKSDGDIFEVHALSKEEHIVNVAYYVQYYYPQEQEPDIDGFTEPANPTKLSISFAAAKDDSDENSPDEPNLPIISDKENGAFKDEEGNRYTKDEIELKIEEMEEADFEKYQRVIAHFAEFKDIPSYQITYYQAALYADDVRVQPDEMYDLTLPYPGTASADKDFVIYQFKDGNTDGAVLLEYTADSDGIHIKVDNVSAFVVGWKEADKATADGEEHDSDESLENQLIESKSDTATFASVNTGDDIHIVLWISLLCLSSFVTIALLKKRSEIHH